MGSRVLRILLVALVLVASLSGAWIYAAEGIEVVAVGTRDASGVSTTRLWIVDDQGRAYLRGVPGGWADRVVAQGEVTLERPAGTPATRMRAIERREEPLRARVNRAFRAKYGWRDRFISILVGDPDRENVVVIELLPLDASS